MSPTLQTDLGTAVDDLQAAAQRAISDRTPDALESLEQQLGRFETRIRERQQERCAEHARAAIRNLESGRPLTPEDQSVIRALVISDAETYVAHENNFDEWLVELERVLGEMADLAGHSDMQSLADLRGVTRDAVRLVPNIRAYIEETHRVDRFNAAMAHLDEANRELLAELLREKISSPTR